MFIIGESFSTSANVTISGNPCKIQSNTDNEVCCPVSLCLVVVLPALNICSLPQIICLGPANVGSGHQLVVTAGGQSSTPYNFNYDPPVITSVTPNLIDGYDGQTITIYGHNFGLPADPTHYFLITVSGSTCAYPLFLFEYQVSTSMWSYPHLCILRGDVLCSCNASCPACKLSGSWTSV